MTETIDITAIELGGGTQARAALDEPTVAEYAAAMRDGAQFPPVVVYFDGEKYWLGDGFHRVAGAKAAGLDTVAALIRQGTRRDAVLHSVGANSTHGLKRTNADKRRAVETLLRDEEWGLWADREIARRAGVTPTFVGTIRAELKATVQHLQSSVRKGADGREIDTARIGKQSAHWSETPLHEAQFWAAVDRYELERATVLGQLQPGCTSLRDLSLSRKEAMSALERLAEDRLRQSFPVGTWLVHTTVKQTELAQVTGYSGNSLRVSDPHPNHWAYHWGANEVRLASDDEVEAYQRIVATAKKRQYERATAGGKGATLLQFDRDKPEDVAILALDWQARYAAMRDRIPAKTSSPLLVLTVEDGHLILGADAVAAASEKGKLHHFNDTPALAGTATYGYTLSQGYPDFNIFYYNEPSLEAQRAQYEVLTHGKAAILPGDLVRDTTDGVLGLVRSIAGKQVWLDKATFVAGEHEHEAVEFKHLEHVQRWTPGEPVLDPGVRPPLPLPPTPWQFDRNGAIGDADGEPVGLSTHWGDRVRYDYYLRRVVDIVNCPASAYTGDADLAGALDRVGRLTGSDDPQAYDALADDLALLETWLSGIRNHLLQPAQVNGGRSRAAAG